MKNTKIRALTGLVALGLVFFMLLVLDSCTDLFDEGAISPHYRPETERLISKVWFLKEWHRTYQIVNPNTGDTIIIADEHYEGRKWRLSDGPSPDYTRALIFGPLDLKGNRTLDAVYGVERRFLEVGLLENGLATNVITNSCRLGVRIGINWGWVNTNKPVIKFFFGEESEHLYGDNLKDQLIERWEVNRLTDNQLLLSGIDSYVFFYIDRYDAAPGFYYVDSKRDIFGIITENDSPIRDQNNVTYYDVELAEYERRVKRDFPNAIFLKEAYALFETVEEPYCDFSTEPCTEELPCQNDGVFNSATCECDCPEGFTGELCETPVEDCSDNTPCVNGTVVPNAFGDGCDCDCDEGWYGFACSETNALVSTVAGGFQGSQDGTGDNAQFYAPVGVDLAGNGDLIIADANNHRIRRMTTDGTVTTIAGSFNGYVDSTSAEARFSIPIDVAFDNQGNIYVADQNNHCIRFITTNGQVTTLAGNGTIGIATHGMIGASNTPTFAYPRAIALDAAEEWLYVVDNSYRIMRMKVTNTPTERVIEIVAGVAQTKGFKDGPADEARFEECSDIALDNNNNIYVADDRNNAVRFIDTKDGIVSTIAGNPPTVQNPINLPANDKFDRIGGLAWTPGGIYLTDLRNHRIRVLQPFDDGVWVAANIAGDYEFNNSGMVGNSSGFVDGLGNEARFEEPYGILVDALGNLYVSDSKNNAIRHVRIGN